jgi:D-arabinose 1-dehydrogenase-like Zn-dependent alcohol dehydrogenase
MVRIFLFQTIDMKAAAKSIKDAKSNQNNEWRLNDSREEMLDFCSKHDIELIPIQNVNEAYERVVSSDVRYRFVIDMKSLESRD